MEGVSVTLVGINTKGKDPELIKSVIRCLGVDFFLLDSYEAENDYDALNRRKGGVIFLRENCKSYDEYFGEIGCGIEVKGCYDMYLGVQDYTINCEFEKIAEELFGVLNKLLGSTDVCYIEINEVFEYSDHNSITEYIDSDLKKYNDRCTSESSKKNQGKYYNVSQETKDKLIKNSTNLGYTELTAMILDKLR